MIPLGLASGAWNEALSGEESNTRRLGMVFAQAILPPANKADRQLPGGVNESIKSHKLAQKSDFSLRSGCC